MRFRGKVGYLMNRYLAFWTGPEDALDTQLDTASEDLAATGLATVRSASERQAAVYEADLDDAAILGHLPDGAEVEILEIADGWCHIRFDGHEGYMIGEDLEMAQGG